MFFIPFLNSCSLKFTLGSFIFLVSLASVLFHTKCQTVVVLISIKQILKPNFEEKNRFFWWFIREVAATEKKGEKKTPDQCNVCISFAYKLHLNKIDIYKPQKNAIY